MAVAYGLPVFPCEELQLLVLLVKLRVPDQLLPDASPFNSLSKYIPNFKLWFLSMYERLSEKAGWTKSFPTAPHRVSQLICAGVPGMPLQLVTLGIVPRVLFSGKS